MPTEPGKSRKTKRNDDETGDETTTGEKQRKANAGDDAKAVKAKNDESGSKTRTRTGNSWQTAATGAAAKRATKWRRKRAAVTSRRKRRRGGDDDAGSDGKYVGK